ncbi:hypothetical protein DU508_18935 [Pedobacter chinensis]|uniref:DUF4293 family protein n=1 Tax=Pedobacter chinensis TaxID=2282421 RepID=A0A369PQR9_9SPHI|nr:hypothetical protein [Pedobacter chinensis]RDC54894.1 hypothetical protein DU508_18935 [Pedobacter chinensis]
MKYLKIISIISFLLINGLGEHGIPNFAGIFLCLHEFLTDIITLPHTHEIAWGLGLFAISAIGCILIILFSKKYRDRYLLVFSFMVLIAIEIYSSGILRYNKITLWFIFPFLVFIVSSVVLILRSFKSQRKSIPDV